MKKIALYIFILFPFQFSFSSGNYGNEWINYDQLYFKIKVAEEGIYRIDYNDLLIAGFLANYSNLDPRYFQIYAKGEEQYIYVAGEDDGVFGTDSTKDYIEFYASKNDGWLDSLMYDDPTWMTNPYYSLINDTIIYYLTVSNTSMGKRMSLETDTAFTGYSPSSYFMKEVLYEEHTRYRAGEYNSSSKFYQNPYIDAEGWTGGAWDYGSTLSYSISTENYYSLGPNSETEIVFTSVSQPTTCDATTSHHFQASFLNESFDTLFGGYKTIHIKDTFSSADIVANSTSFYITSLTDYCNPGAVAEVAFSYIRLKYPHTYDLSNSSSLSMFIPDDSVSSKAYLSISNFSTSSSPIFYDLSNHNKIALTGSNGSYEALLPNSGGLKKCYLTSESKVKTFTWPQIKSNQIRPVTTGLNYAMFTDFSKTSGNFVIITHSGLMNEANDYKNYRDQTGYTSIVVDIDELYGQFGGGIEKHPLAITRFSDYIFDSWTDTAEYIFLIGKSIRNEICRNSNYTSYSNNGTYTTNFANNLIPTMGYPGSDHLMVSGLNEKKYVPGIAIGRISATASQEVSDYLTKMEDYESATVDEWMKKVIQFSGGSDTTEQNKIKAWIHNYEDILEDSLYGCSVFTFYKETSDDIEDNPTNSLSDSISDLFNAGVNMVNLFAHAAGTMFSFGLTTPDQYSNEGKYPLIIANSCSAGAIHDIEQSDFTKRSLSEQWPLYPNGGSIAFLASVTSGQPGYLNTFTKQLFELFSDSLYGQSLGKLIKQTINNIIDTTDPYSIGVCSDMCLQGDPSIKLNVQTQPDLSIADRHVFFTPTEITADLDSFDVNIIVTNIGRAFGDTFSIELIRTFSSGSADPFMDTIKVAGAFFQDTVTVTMALDNINGVGLNQLQIALDAEFEIDELNELNNTLSTSFMVYSKDAFPIYPYKYAIVPTDSITLKASTSNVFASEMKYIFQIDTTDTYDSPFLKEKIIQQIGGVLNWTLPFTLEDSMVYYWRVGPISYTNDNTNGNNGGIVSGKTAFNSNLWRESSFTYINGKTGWSQSHIFQFKENEFNDLEINRDLRKFDFNTRTKRVDIWNTGKMKVNADVESVGLQLDNINKDCGDFLQHQVRIYVIDSLSLEPWVPECNGENPEHDFDQYDRCGAGKQPPLYGFDFWMSNPHQFHNMLKNAVPDGNYFAFLIILEFFDQYNWPDSTLDLIESLGGISLKNLVGTQNAYSLFAKKGDPSSAIEGYNTGYGLFNINTEIKGRWDYGSMTSELIGPAQKWESLYWNEYAMENNSMDSIRLSVIGINDSSGVEEVIAGLESISVDSLQSITNLDTIIDASIYPYIKLKVYMHDDSLYTPALLDRWQVIYQEMPEAALNPALGYAFNSDTLQEGQILDFSIVIENTSKVDMDSLLVSYYVTDKNNSKHDLSYPRLDSLLAGDTLVSSITFNTLGYTGNNSLWININPATNNVYDQWEQYHFNNTAQKSFYVVSDEENPILDVTFDGAHIMDGELISAKPYIVMRLNDENQYLLMDATEDTSNFDIELTTPSGITSPVYFMEAGQEILKFTPGDSSNNTFLIEYNAEFPEDGTYQLSVHATDASKNASGDFDYQISFEVINESTITHIINYPNPFSTSTRFVFTLTGSEVPDYFKIQIMTVSGKVVREINTDEIGDIKIGHNISEFAWDGKDEFGDPLANGLYLYRVITSINGEEIKHRSEEGLDTKDGVNTNYFKKGFGKMYLMR